MGYSILTGGRLGNWVSAPASGAVPYGFAFSPTNPNLLVVSDAAADAVTSYSFNNNVIQTVDGPVADQQVAPCWLVITNNGRWAYTANAGSQSVSGYTVNNDGRLTLLNTTSTGTGNAPIEMALSPDSATLYTLNTTNGPRSLSGFRIQQDGGLGALYLPTITLPTGSTGIAAN
ncbi:lactonase family protein [Ktedonobacteria bacterium brp13]|nr:lactonase family protein [Ktedonobacteria bacterium brp13]